MGQPPLLPPPDEKPPREDEKIEKDLDAGAGETARGTAVLDVSRDETELTGRAQPRERRAVPEDEVPTGLTNTQEWLPPDPVTSPVLRFTKRSQEAG